MSFCQCGFIGRENLESSRLLTVKQDCSSFFWLSTPLIPHELLGLTGFITPQVGLIFLRSKNLIRLQSHDQK